MQPFLRVCEVCADLDEAILCESDKCHWHCGNEHPSNGNEAANEDKEAQQTNARNLKQPHAQHRQRCVG